MTVAYDVTQRLRPPRAVFVNYPMGNTCGRPNDTAVQRAIVGAALERGAAIEEPATIVELGYAFEGTTSPDGRSWQDWEYTKDFQRHHMRKRDGSAWD